MEKKIPLLIVVCALVMIGCDNQKNDKTVVIACNLPLTGDVAIYGISVRDGILFAQNNMKNEGKQDTLKLNFLIQDNKSSNSDAVSILNRQLYSSPNMYISGLDHQTKAIIDKITENKIPHFTYSWEPFICKTGVNNFRTGINLEQESDYYIKFIENKKPKKLAIIHINDPGSFIQFDSIVIPQAKRLGVLDIKEEAFDFETNNFKPIAAKIKSYNPDAIIIAGYDTHLSQLIRDFRNYELINSDNTMCSVDLLDASNILPPELLENIRFTCPYFIYNNDDNLKWKDDFEKMFKRKARYGDAYAYDMVYIIYDAFVSANGNYTNENITEKIKNTNINGITGHLIFNENRDLSLNLNVCYYKNGNIIKETY